MVVLRGLAGYVAACLDFSTAAQKGPEISIKQEFWDTRYGAAKSSERKMKRAIAHPVLPLPASTRRKEVSSTYSRNPVELP